MLLVSHLRSKQSPQQAIVRCSQSSNRVPTGTSREAIGVASGVATTGHIVQRVGLQIEQRVQKAQRWQRATLGVEQGDSRGEDGSRSTNIIVSTFFLKQKKMKDSKYLVPSTNKPLPFTTM